MLRSTIKGVSAPGIADRRVTAHFSGRKAELGTSWKISPRVHHLPAMCLRLVPPHSSHESSSVHFESAQSGRDV